MRLSKFTRIFSIFIMAVFSVLAILFIINFSEYIGTHFENKGMNVPQFAVYSVGAILCIPCVAVLIIALPLSDAIENDTVFTKKTSSILSLISKILFLDCIAFLVAIVALFISKEFTFSPILGIVDLVGFSLSVLLRVLSSYIDRAADLKEEADYTL